MVSGVPFDLVDVDARGCLGRTLRLELLEGVLGELVVEKSGVLNLGVEGMMLVGALAAFITVSHQGGLALGVLAGMGAGALLALVFLGLWYFDIRITWTIILVIAAGIIAGVSMVGTNLSAKFTTIAAALT